MVCFFFNDVKEISNSILNYMIYFAHFIDKETKM